MTDDLSTETAVAEAISEPPKTPLPPKVPEMAKEKRKIRNVILTFRLLESEAAVLKGHIHYAFLVGQIGREKFSDYFMYCLNAGHDKLYQIYDRKSKP